ncbi:GGDEF domain-containing protein [Desulfoscipio gibsoniae]
MKKLNLSEWRSPPPSLIFSGSVISDLSIEWPTYKSKNEYIDPLTGIPNRRAFDEVALQAVRTANQQGAGFGLIILDIDHFKKVNDTHGHQAGDAVLQAFAAILQSILREDDFCARIGGEEFVIVSPAWDKTFEIGERVRTSVENQMFTLSGGKQTKITCSFGYAIYPEDAYDFVKLFEMADQGLYKAKNTGRNQGMKDSFAKN